MEVGEEQTLTAADEVFRTEWHCFTQWNYAVKQPCFLLLFRLVVWHFVAFLCRTKWKRQSAAGLELLASTDKMFLPTHFLCPPTSPIVDSYLYRSPAHHYCHPTALPLLPHVFTHMDPHWQQNDGGLFSTDSCQSSEGLKWRIKRWSSEDESELRVQSPTRSPASRKIKLSNLILTSNWEFKHFLVSINLFSLKFWFSSGSLHLIKT